MFWRLAELSVAPLRQFFGCPWSFVEVQSERMAVKSMFQPLN